MARHGVDQPVFLLRCNRNPVSFKSNLQVIYIDSFGVSNLSYNTPKIICRVVRRMYWLIEPGNTIVIGPAVGNVGYT